MPDSSSRTALKRQLGRLVKPRAATDRRVILTYHAVGSGPWSQPISAFAEQMEWLAQNTHVMSLPALLRHTTASDLQVAISFDDGYECVFSQAAPVLKEAGMTATVFVNTAFMRDEERVPSREDLGHYPGERFMTWPEVAALANDGWVIGSHGAEHLDMTTQPAAVVRRQFAASKRDIERRLNTHCGFLAYPWGRSNARVRKVAAESGYTAAVSARHGAVSERADDFAVPRIDIRREYQMSDFIAALTGEWDYLQYVQALRELTRRARL